MSALLSDEVETLVLTHENRVSELIKAIKEGLKLSKDGIIIPFSAETKQGRDEIWALIDELTGLAATEEA